MNKRKIAVWLFVVVVVVLALPIVWFTYIGGTAYIYASHLESKWVPAKPQTKTELENHLNLYYTRIIDPKDSMWGSHWKLADNEQMIQYCMLWNKRCPLDVVYDSQDNIVQIFTSYE